ALTLAPARPENVRSARSGQNEVASAAARSDRPQVPSPIPRTGRSPTRSVSSPHGINEIVDPASEAAIRAPVSPRLRPYWERRAGARTATPNQIADHDV